MTDILSEIDTPSDAELISRVRGGDVAAYGDLFARHVEAANRLARQLVRGPDADDLVSEAFAKVLSVLQGGGGPDVAFRAYLLTAVRRLHVDKVRASSRLQTSDDMTAFDPGVPFQDTAVAAFESGAAAKAFASLPERWQMVLWHLEVEGQKPAEIAALLGMSANSVSALAYRAREGLRQAFLTMHLHDISETECRWTNEHLGAYIRKGLAKRDGAKVQTHLDGCRRCTAMYLELTEVNSNLRALIAPLLLGTAATGYLASAGSAAGSAGVMAVVGRVRDALAANAGVATAGAVAATVAAAAAAGIVIVQSGSSERVSAADEPISATSTLPRTGTTGDPVPDAVASTSAGDPGTLVGEPVSSPAAVPAVFPLPSGSSTPTATPDAAPSDVPVLAPLGEPAGETAATADPGAAPSGSAAPSAGESALPSQDPSPSESALPSQDPSPSESALPSQDPSPSESALPSVEPSPSQTPTEPVPVTTNLSAAGASLSDGHVRFTLQGSPELPPTVTVSLSADPDGILFGGGGTCSPLTGDPTKVLCQTANPLVTAPFTRATTTATGASFDVDLPLVIPPGQPDTTITLTLVAPAGYQDPDLGDDSLVLGYVAPVTPPPTPTADVALTLGELTDRHQVSADGTDSYVVRTAVSGWPADGGPLTVTLSEAAALAAPVAGCTLSDSGTVLTCEQVSGDLVLDLRVVSASDLPTSFSATVSSPAGYLDPSADNTDDVLLTPTPEVAVRLSMSDDLDGKSGKGSVTATVDAPAGVEVRLTASFDAADLEVTPTSTGCTVTAGLITCTVTGGGSVDLDVALVDRPNASGSATLSLAATPVGAVDLDPSDNSGSVSVQRKG
ncbi:sigma-70 family RNA polymerase sigma factor [Nocardioides mesophilus]|uniref:Sigma-70 family RNA polymerase sigma factor n=1 Tax=Nocardioides mesophilus TaxID=433659 RepID=A0A7G9R8K4_9ACTN|nr:sigma-70 family RNA polymerase sigma factor [Nocardioides mesophilus]QNN51929.1 sigma-70 family RNA polymerase sigma factor [Nocardioides mesophilus]